MRMNDFHWCLCQDSQDPRDSLVCVIPRVNMTRKGFGEVHSGKAEVP